MRAALGGQLEGRTVGILGLSFKPETDDVREAPSLDILRGLLERGIRVRAYDPEAMRAAISSSNSDSSLVVTGWGGRPSGEVGRVALVNAIHSPSGPKRGAPPRPPI